MGSSSVNKAILAAAEQAHACNTVPHADTRNYAWLTGGRVVTVPPLRCRDVADNSISGVIPAEWATGMSSLRMANVSNNSLAG
jgi:hypothetical protein